MDKATHFLSGQPFRRLTQCLSFFLFLLAGWAFIGGLWNPLYPISYGLNKGVGFLSLLCLLLYIWNPTARQRAQEFVSTLNKINPTSLKVANRFLFLSLWFFLSFLAIYKHNSLQSHTFELGIFNNVVWNIAHGNGFHDSVLNIHSYLGDHWQPILIAFAPIIYVIEEGAVFLTAQAFFIALGAAGLYNLARYLTQKNAWAYFCALVFLLHPDLHKIHRFDFHPETIGFALFPWMIYFLETGRKKWIIPLFIIALTVVKEDFPVYCAAFGGLFFFKPGQRKWGFLIGGLSLIAFYVTSFVLMPHFLGNDIHTHMSRYDHLGPSLPAILQNPFPAVKNAIQVSIFNPLVWETALRYLAPLLFLPLFNGPMTLAAFISWSPHAISQYPPQQTLQCQYGVAILAFLAAGVCFGLASFLNEPRSGSRLGRFIQKVGPLPPLFLLMANFSFGVPRYYKPIEKSRVLTFREMIKVIPPDAVVSGQQDLGPHLSFRKDFHLFPDIEKADYVVLDHEGSHNPLKEHYWTAYEEFKNLPYVELIQFKDGFGLFKVGQRPNGFPIFQEDLLTRMGIYRR